MTRINVIHPKYLSDQHLRAEYRELPRVIKQCFNIDGVYDRYILGKGHVKWAKVHSKYLIKRYKLICEEMEHRNFVVNYPFIELYKIYEQTIKPEYDNDYKPDLADLELNRQRLIEKYKLKPDWYTWTNRERPTNSIFNGR